MSLALILTFCFGSIHWQYLACSLEGTQWVCAASTATHIRNTSWLQAGKYPNEPCNITWFCARITFCMVGTTVYEHCFLVFCLLVQNVQPTHSSVMWLQVLLLLQLWWAGFAVGFPEYEAASQWKSHGWWSVEVEVASYPSTPAAGSLHAQWLPYP